MNIKRKCRGRKGSYRTTNQKGNDWTMKAIDNLANVVNNLVVEMRAGFKRIDNTFAKHVKHLKHHDTNEKQSFLDEPKKPFVFKNDTSDLEMETDWLMMKELTRR